MARKPTPARPPRQTIYLVACADGKIRECNTGLVGAHLIREGARYDAAAMDAPPACECGQGGHRVIAVPIPMRRRRKRVV